MKYLMALLSLQDRGQRSGKLGEKHLRESFYSICLYTYSGLSLKLKKSLIIHYNIIQLYKHSKLTNEKSKREDNNVYIYVYSYQIGHLAANPFVDLYVGCNLSITVRGHD